MEYEINESKEKGEKGWRISVSFNFIQVNEEGKSRMSFKTKKYQVKASMSRSPNNPLLKSSLLTLFLII